MFAQLWAAGVPSLIVCGSVCVINARHVLYSASIAAYLRYLPLRWRILLGYLLTDEAYAISIRRFQHEPPGPNQHFHLLGSGMLLWTNWQFSTIFGVLVGGTLPDSWSLSFALPLPFIAIVPPILKPPADLAAPTNPQTIAIIRPPLH